MFSDSQNIKCTDDLNCIIYNQNVMLGSAAELMYTTSVKFSASFILDRRPPDVTFNTMYITTDNEKVNFYNSTIARIRRYHTCGKTVYIDASYFSNLFDNTFIISIAEVLANHGKDLRCIANVTENGGVRIKIFLEHI